MSKSAKTKLNKKTKLKSSKKTASFKKSKIYTIFIVVAVTIVILVVAGLAISGNLDAIISAISNYIDQYNNSTAPPSTNANNSLDLAEGDLAVHFVDVGQGDCIILQFPDGKTMIIDGGDRDSSIAKKVRKYINSLNITKFDYVLLTHTDADHCGSLDDALDEVENVEKVFLPKINTKNKEYNAALGLSESVVTITTQVYSDFVSQVLASTYKVQEEVKSTEYQFLIDEIVIESGSYRMTMYCATESYYESFSQSNSKAINDVSPICVLEYANKKVIFTGDANNSASNTSAEKRFINALKAKGILSYKSDVLKVAHHGGKESSGTDFLQFVAVDYAVVSVGTKNGKNSSGEFEGFVSNSYYQKGYTFVTQGNGAYDHPHRDVVGVPQNGEGRLAASGVSELYRTDTHGDIVLVISPEKDVEFCTQIEPSVVDGVVVFVEVKLEMVAKDSCIHIYYEERLRMF